MLTKIEDDVVRVWDWPDDDTGPKWRDAEPDEVVPALVKMVGELQRKLRGLSD